MSILSLSDTLWLHKAAGRLPLSPAITSGEFEITLRDLEGNIETQLKQHNMPTHMLMAHLAKYNNVATTLYLVISNDLNDMHPQKTMVRSTYANGDDMALAASISRSLTNLTWTMEVTFPNPSRNRDFQFVGVSLQNNLTASPAEQLCPGIIAGTKITSLLTQTITNILQIKYRISFNRV